MQTNTVIRLGWGWVVALSLLLACLLGLSNRAGAAGNGPKNWHVTVFYGDGRVEAQDHLEEIHIDTEAGELVTVDWDGERIVWNLAEHGVASAIAVSWDEVRVTK